jgi:hypothetical protein
VRSSKYQRIVHNDHTVTFKNLMLQLPPTPERIHCVRLCARRGQQSCPAPCNPPPDAHPESTFSHPHSHRGWECGWKNVCCPSHKPISGGLLLCLTPTQSRGPSGHL